MLYAFLSFSAGFCVPSSSGTVIFSLNDAESAASAVDYAGGVV